MKTPADKLAITPGMSLWGDRYQWSGHRAEGLSAWVPLSYGPLFDRFIVKGIITIEAEQTEQQSAPMKQAA